MQIRIAPSLGELEGHPNDIWGTETYKSDFYGALRAPVVFFGLYGLRDFFDLWNHKGEKHILWAGSDIRHFVAGYWLDAEGKIRISPRQLALWLAQNCIHWVENEVEARALEMHGIKVNIVPSFLGRIEDFPLSFVKQDKVRLYTSVSGNDFELYGWNLLPMLAYDNPDVEFHLFGHTELPEYLQFPLPKNIIPHGRVPKEVMNAETKRMTGALRLTQFDGFSEILAKSVLWGQWPISLIDYPHMLLPRDIGKLKNKIEPNVEGREYYLKILNKYPWNLK